MRLDYSVWMCIFLPMFIVFFMQQQAKKRMKHCYILEIIKHHKKRGDFNMSEIVKNFIGKECIITTMN